MTSPALDRFRLQVERTAPGATVLTGPEALEPYTRDWSGHAPCWPDVAIRCTEAPQVEAVLTAADRHQIPVTPRGMGSGKAGGALAVHGGAVLDVSGCTGIVDVSAADLVAVVRAGTPTSKVYEAVEAEGLFYAPDPNSAHLCSIGGNVACNAGGPRAIKYGVTKHHVLGLQVVTPASGTLDLGGRVVKRAAGYDLTGLMVGSEGTLGVITEVTLRLLPRPRGIGTALVGFSDAAQAGRAVTQVFRAGVLPRALEFLDSAATAVVRKDLPDLVSEAFAALLIVETDGPSEEEATAQLERVAQVMLDQGALDVQVAQTATQRERIWGPRRMLSEGLRRTAARKLSEDVTVPRSRIPELLHRLEPIARETGIRLAAYGHAGDGNLHVNFLFEEDQEPSARIAMEAVSKVAVSLGGTVSGEHGIGILKRDLLAMELSSTQLELQKSLKRTFDPQQILNPGKLFPARGARP